MFTLLSFDLSSWLIAQSVLAAKMPLSNLIFGESGIGRLDSSCHGSVYMKVNEIVMVPRSMIIRTTSAFALARKLALV